MVRPLDLAYILPLGYSPALETEYITPCKNGCECSTLKSARRWAKDGFEIPGNLIEPRRYQYHFSWLPYKRLPIKLHPFNTRKIDCTYLICTGCHKPATTFDANKINRVLGFTEPKYEAQTMDLDWTLSGF